MSNSVIFCQLNTTKGTAISLTVVILDFSTLSCTILHILTLTRYGEYPIIFV